MTDHATPDRAGINASVRAVLIAELDAAIQRCPNLRVCQLIVNATGCDDPFYVEDWALIKALRGYQEAARQ